MCVDIPVESWVKICTGLPTCLLLTYELQITNAVKAQHNRGRAEFTLLSQAGCGWLPILTSKFARTQVTPLVGTQLILKNQLTKSVLLALCLPSDRFSAGVQCGLPAFIVDGGQDIDSSGCGPDTDTSCQATNTLTFEFNNATIPADAQSVLCGLTTNNVTAQAWNASKWSQHAPGIFLIGS